MSLRCKPGDLCVIIACEVPDEEIRQQVIGRFVTVERLISEDLWLFTETFTVKYHCGGAGCGGAHKLEVAGAADFRLQPIRGQRDALRERLPTALDVVTS